MKRDWEIKNQVFIALIIASLVGVGLFIYCAITNHSLVFSYLLVNLALGWVPLLVSARLVAILRKKDWSSWEGMLLSLVWIIFLPNSFYMISDFIHLVAAPANSLIYYAVTFTSIIYTSVVIGFVSLYMVHIELLRRLSKRRADVFISLILVACSVAIYLGRDLRWNSWAILTNPGGIIFDISDRLIHVGEYPTVLATSGMFFVILSSMYFLFWSGIKVVKRGSAA